MGVAILSGRGHDGIGREIVPPDPRGGVGGSEMLVWFEKIVFYIRVALIRCGKRVGDVQSVFSGHLWLL